MSEWQRVSRHHPCEICNHADWCTFNNDGACCMRIDSPKPMHNGGYWHRRGSSTTEQPIYNRKTAVQLRTHAPDFAALIDRWSREKAGEVESYAATLGVGWKDLIDLNVCWAPEYGAFAFPMYRPTGEIVGIRLRNATRKWSVLGSHQGLFIPFAAIRRVESLNPVLIVEGPTDTAAGLALGFLTIGRPNNLVGGEMVREVLKELQVVKEIIVCYDNDWHIDSMGNRIRPGALGAERLIKELRRPVIRFIPPTKDLRSFLQEGGSRKLLLSVVQSTVRW